MTSFSWLWRFPSAMGRLSASPSRFNSMQAFTRMLITALVFGMSLSATGAEKYALLIGVAKYDHAEMNKPEALQFPEEDAKALGKLLESGGYKVEMLLGKTATQAAIKSEFSALQKKADAEGVVLVGMFGHGVEVDTVDAAGGVFKDGCFCPFDTAMRESLDFKGKPVLDAKGKTQIEPDPDTLIKLGDLMKTLKLAKAGNRIVLADCCRTTPNAARGRTFGANFSVQDLPDNTSMLFGCSPNEQAFEHKDWGHGAFTKCLLDTIGELSVDGPVDTAQLASQMKKRVPALVASVSPRNRQTPKPFITDVVDLQLEMKRSLPTNPDLLTNSIGMELIEIPAGKFTMGSPADEKDRLEDEEQVRVTLRKPFRLGKTEVTQGQWKSVMGTEPWDGEKFVQADKDCPATYVSYFDAVEFCDTLTAIERKAGKLKADEEYRLPTEAQWEYACRAGTTTAFSFGDESKLNAHAWWGAFDLEALLKGELKAGEGNAAREQYAHTVGTKKPNPWGLHDMHGNVWEWCSDCYDGKLAGGIDPVGPERGSPRVYRGGGWGNIPGLCRSANRSNIVPSSRSSDLGFRVARSQSAQ